MTDAAHDLRTRLDALFREELRETLNLFSDALDELAQGADEPLQQKLVPELFRAAHNLRGAAHVAKVLAAVEPSRRIEDGLAPVSAGAQPLHEDLLATISAAVDELGLIHQQLTGHAAGGGP